MANGPQATELAKQVEVTQAAVQAKDREAQEKGQAANMHKQQVAALEKERDDAAAKVRFFISIVLLGSANNF